VGDSLGMVIQGHDTTLPVTMEDVIYHMHGLAPDAVSKNGQQRGRCNQP